MGKTMRPAQNAVKKIKECLETGWRPCVDPQDRPPYGRTVNYVVVAEWWLWRLNGERVGGGWT